VKATLVSLPAYDAVQIRKLSSPGELFVLLPAAGGYRFRCAARSLSVAKIAVPNSAPSFASFAAFHALRSVTTMSQYGIASDGAFP